MRFYVRNKEDSRMGVVALFSKREGDLEKAGQPDVYKYDSLPLTFRRQVAFIWEDAIGPFVDVNSFSSFFNKEPVSNKIWQLVHDTLRREKGLFNLGKPAQGPFEQCKEYLLTAETGDALDIVEVSFRIIDFGV